MLYNISQKNLLFNRFSYLHNAQLVFMWLYTVSSSLEIFSTLLKKSVNNREYLVNMTPVSQAFSNLFTSYHLFLGSSATCVTLPSGIFLFFANPWNAK